VKLTVVGSASAWTRRPGHASSCYLVEHDGHAIVLDLGQGAFAELSRYRQPADIEAVVVSHLHPDHFVDLVPARHYLRYEAMVPERVEVHGPAELAARLDGLFAQSDFLDGIRVKSLVPGSRSVAGFTVEAGRVTHIPDSFAFRLSTGAGPGLVYSGDCGVADDLAGLIRPGDVVLCEAAYGAAPQGDPIHLNSAAAAGVAAGAGAARLILTHLLDRSDHAAAVSAAASIFGPEVTIAEPGLRVEVG
jgi:ribonuclease BN (tRNA processing enzyme)